MMIRNFLYCNICNQQLLIKVQISAVLKQYPTFINCINCETEISFIVREEKLLKIKNATSFLNPVKEKTIGLYNIAGEFFVSQRSIIFKNLQELEQNILNNRLGA